MRGRITLAAAGALILGAAVVALWPAYIHATNVPNLNLAISGPSGTHYGGQDVAYALSYSNIADAGNPSPADSTGVVLTLSPPMYTVFDAASSTPGWVCPSNCTLAVGSLPAGSSGSATFAATVQSQIPGGNTSFPQSAQIDDDHSHGASAGNHTPMTPGETQIADAPNLVVAQTGPPAAVYSGQTATYTIDFSNLVDAVNNPGPADATGVALRDTVPQDTTFSAAGSTPGWSCADGAAAGTMCTLPIGGFPAGSSDPKAFSVMVGTLPPGTNSVSNTVAIADDGTHGTPTGNGSVLLSSTAGDVPNLNVAISVSPNSVQQGQVTAYSIAYDNAASTADPAPSGATGVALHESVPAGMWFSSAGSTAGWSCANGAAPGTVCTLAVGTVPAGGGGTAHFNTTPASNPASTQSVNNTASVSDDGTHGVAQGSGSANATVSIRHRAPAAPAAQSAAPPSPTPTPSPAPEVSPSPAPAASSAGPASPQPAQTPPAPVSAYDYGTRGGAAIVAAGGPDAFDVVNNDPNHTISPFDVALVSPGHIATDAVTLSTNLLVSLVVLLLMGFAGEMINRTWKVNHMAIRRAFARLIGPGRGLLNSGFGLIRGIPGVALLCGFALSAAVIQLLLDPHARLDRATLALWLGLGLAFLLVTTCWELPAVFWLRSRAHQVRMLRILPEALPIAGLCVLLSRVTGLHPGYVFGVLAACAVVRGTAPAAEEAKGALICGVTVILLAAVAYLLTGVVADALHATPGGPANAPFWLLVLNTAMPGVVMACLSCLVFGLMPFQMMRGAILMRWSKVAWASLYGFGAFALLGLVIHPSGGLTAKTHLLVASLVPYVLIAVLAFSFYLLFRVRARLAAPQPAGTR